MNTLVAAGFCYGLAAGISFVYLLDWASAHLGDYLHARHQRRTT